MNIKNVMDTWMDRMEVVPGSQWLGGALVELSQAQAAAASILHMSKPPRKKQQCPFLSCPWKPDVIERDS